MGWKKVGNTTDLEGVDTVNTAGERWFGRFSTGEPQFGSGICAWRPGEAQLEWKRVFENENVFGVRSICVSKDMVIVLENPTQSGFNNLHALDPETGDTVWTTTTELKLLQGGLTIDGDEIVLYGLDTEIFSTKIVRLQTNTGEIVATNDTPDGKEFAHIGDKFIIRCQVLGLYVAQSDSNEWHHLVEGKVTRLIAHGESFYYVRPQSEDEVEIVWRGADNDVELGRLSVGEVQQSTTYKPMHEPGLIGLYHYRESGFRVVDLESQTICWELPKDGDVERGEVVDTPHGLVIGPKSIEDGLRTYDSRSGQLVDRSALEIKYDKLIYSEPYLLVSGLYGTQILEWSENSVQYEPAAREEVEESESSSDDESTGPISEENGGLLDWNPGSGELLPRKDAFELLDQLGVSRWSTTPPSAGRIQWFDRGGDEIASADYKVILSVGPGDKYTMGYAIDVYDREQIPYLEKSDDGPDIVVGFSEEKVWQRAEDAASEHGADFVYQCDTLVVAIFNFEGGGEPGSPTG